MKKLKNKYLNTEKKKIYFLMLLSHLVTILYTQIWAFFSPSSIQNKDTGSFNFFWSYSWLLLLFYNNCACLEKLICISKIAYQLIVCKNQKKKKKKIKVYHFIIFTTEITEKRRKETSSKFAYLNNDDNINTLNKSSKIMI